LTATWPTPVVGHRSIFLPPLPIVVHQQLWGATTIVYNDRLYLLGGMNRREVVAHCYYFDMKLLHWNTTHCTSMIVPRRYAASSYCNGYFYGSHLFSFHITTQSSGSCPHCCNQSVLCVHII
jgi:hypothetical protein